jgi:uncharacterized protein (DUF433 family)
VSVKALRQALRYAEQTLGIERLLLRKEICTQAGEVFLDRYGELISLSASGQLAMRRVFGEHLKRVVWDTQRFPVRLYPFLSAEALTPERPIAIDPQIAFGRPVVVRKGISTRVIASASTLVRRLAIWRMTTISPRQRSERPCSTSARLEPRFLHRSRSRKHLSRHSLGRRAHGRKTPPMTCSASSVSQAEDLRLPRADFTRRRIV